MAPVAAQAALLGRGVAASASVLRFTLPGLGVEHLQSTWAELASFKLAK